eukprot:COSAG01_NODE_838_length_13194_cov_9.063240_1_plen_235_part_00
MRPPPRTGGHILTGLILAVSVLVSCGSTGPLTAYTRAERPVSKGINKPGVKRQEATAQALAWLVRTKKGGKISGADAKAALNRFSATTGHKSLMKAYNKVDFTEHRNSNKPTAVKDKIVRGMKRTSAQVTGASAQDMRKKKSSDACFIAAVKLWDTEKKKKARGISYMPCGGPKGCVAHILNNQKEFHDGPAIQASDISKREPSSSTTSWFHSKPPSTRAFSFVFFRKKLICQK